MSLLTAFLVVLVPAANVCAQDKYQPQAQVSGLIRSFANCKPGEPLEPKMREFLRYVLSEEGQRALRDEGDYLPLPAEMIRMQSKLLD